MTLSRRQLEWARRANAQAGLDRSVHMFLLDYRDLPARSFDAICSIGAIEHFGCSTTASHIRPTASQGTGRFIDRYVFPDGELQGPGTIIGAMHDHGLELRHGEPPRALRPHPQGVGSQPRAPLAAGSRRGRRAPSAGLAALHGLLASRVRPRPNPDPPDARRAQHRRWELRNAIAPDLGAA